MLRDALSKYDETSSSDGWATAMYDGGFKQRVSRFQLDLGLEDDGLACSSSWETLFGIGVLT